MRKWFILIVVFLLLLVGYNYVYQDHRDIEKETATFVVSSTIISNEFSKNLTESENKYLNKTIEILGIVTELNKKDLTLDNSVFCLFDDKINDTLKVNTQIKIKGRVIGYDDLLELIKLDQCYVIK